MISPRGEAN
jgi:sec-independent protein translocase protein TatA